MNKITHIPRLAKIKQYPKDPIQMFKEVIDRVKAPPIFPMNLATLDNEFGVLNRTVIYRGLLEETWICFVTERNSRKYKNLKENPKLGLTMLFYPDGSKKIAADDILPKTWQVRLLGAEAVELEAMQLQKLWQDEPLLAKIRSHICECGKPRSPEELEARLKEQLEVIEKEKREPEQTESYTAFKIIPKRWDFYKSEPEAIADRVQYKQLDNGEWEVCHVDA